MGVKDIGAKDIAGDFDGRAIEQREADVIVEIIAIVFVVNPGPVIERGAIDKKIANAFADGFHR